MKDPLYYQCHLKMVNGTGTTKGWIEEKGATVGKTMRLTDIDDKARWVVEEVFQPGIPLSKLKEKQANDRNALPSILPKENA